MPWLRSRIRDAPRQDVTFPETARSRPSVKTDQQPRRRPAHGNAGSLSTYANDAIKKLVKEKLASEDDQKRAEGEIQKVTDRHITEIDRLVAAKEAEIMAV